MPLINTAHGQMQTWWRGACWRFVKGSKQFGECLFSRNKLVALEDPELSKYREGIISEWKMFVQEGKALRSADLKLTHMLLTPTDLSSLGAGSRGVETAGRRKISRHYPSVPEFVLMQ